jgi:hypothetical protein
VGRLLDRLPHQLSQVRIDALGIHPQSILQNRLLRISQRLTSRQILHRAVLLWKAGSFNNPFRPAQGLPFQFLKVRTNQDDMAGEPEKLPGRFRLPSAGLPKNPFPPEANRTRQPPLLATLKTPRFASLALQIS